MEGEVPDLRVDWRPEGPGSREEKKIDMKEGYRPAAAKKERKAKRGRSESRDANGRRGGVDLILGPSPRPGDGRGVWCSP
jgi:hypothetical protein